MLAELRHQLEAQRDRIAEQLAAVEAVEQAWAHLETVLGRAHVTLPRAGANGAARAEAAPRAAPLACVCEECGTEFSRRTAKGPRPRRCAKCSKAANAAQQAARAARKREQRRAAEQTGSPPEAAQQRCRFCEKPFEPSQPDQRFCGQACRSAHREQRRAERAGTAEADARVYRARGDDRGYVRALQAAGGRF